jgi:hypothetical protein
MPEMARGVLEIVKVCTRRQALITEKYEAAPNAIRTEGSGRAGSKPVT